MSFANKVKINMLKNESLSMKPAKTRTFTMRASSSFKGIEYLRGGKSDNFP
jgi:hypothetical protein